MLPELLSQSLICPPSQHVNSTIKSLINISLNEIKTKTSIQSRWHRLTVRRNQSLYKNSWRNGQLDFSQNLAWRTQNSAVTVWKSHELLRKREKGRWWWRVIFFSAVIKEEEYFRKCFAYQDYLHHYSYYCSHSRITTGVEIRHVVV